MNSTAKGEAGYKCVNPMPAGLAGTNVDTLLVTYAGTSPSTGLPSRRQDLRKTCTKVRCRIGHSRPFGKSVRQMSLCKDEGADFT